MPTGKRQICRTQTTCMRWGSLNLLVASFTEHEIFRSWKKPHFNAEERAANWHNQPVATSHIFRSIFTQNRGRKRKWGSSMSARQRLEHRSDSARAAQEVLQEGPVGQGCQPRARGQSPATGSFPQAKYVGLAEISFSFRWFSMRKIPLGFKDYWMLTGMSAGRVQQPLQEAELEANPSFLAQMVFSELEGYRLSLHPTFSCMFEIYLANLCGF